MQQHVDEIRFLADISGYLGFHYLSLTAMNWTLAGYLWLNRRSTAFLRIAGWSVSNAAFWFTAGIVFCVMGAIAINGDPSVMRVISLPEWFRDTIDFLMQPFVFLFGVIFVLSGLFLGRHFLVRPMVAWSSLNLALLLLGLSLTDPDFAAIVGKPDNVPILGLLFLIGFFTWLATAKAVRNDQRLANDLPPLEAVDNEKVFVWPDLVYIELICMVALTAFLLLWSAALQAPLEAPANLVDTPNPSKAPWYFVGLQEMLVYFDPWMAGVALPSLIVFGLLAIPYLDPNEHGNGYYTINERKFAYLGFQFGFLALWITLIIMGTFLRGPNWNFFGIYETWDPHKAQTLDNLNLSQYFWIDILEKERPMADQGAGLATVLYHIVLRESPGIVLLSTYLILIPVALTYFVQSFRSLYQRIGVVRYTVLVFLLLMMALLPIKMICRWSFNLKYFISIPEFFLNL